MKCLPVFLSACNRLLVLVGPQYTTRLWCMLECFTFLRLGSAIGRMTIVPLVAKAENATGAATTVADPWGDVDGLVRRRLDAEARARRWFASFDIRLCECYAADRDPLLAVIETGFDDLSRFNHVCAASLLACLQRDVRKRDASVSLLQATYRARIEAGCNALDCTAELRKLVDGQEFARRRDDEENVNET